MNHHDDVGGMDDALLGNSGAFGIFSGPCERGNPDLAHGFEFAPISANEWILVIEAVINTPHKAIGSISPITAL